MKSSVGVPCLWIVSMLMALMPLQSQPAKFSTSSRVAGHTPPNLRRDHLANVDPSLRPFYHGVASGDPSTSSVVLWTRISPEEEIKPQVTWTIARDSGMVAIVRRGAATADPDHHYCVKVLVDSLEAGSTYYYEFQYNNVTSLRGRTKTLPSGNVDRLRFGVVSCSNFPAGYFNAYAALANRNDLDAIIHLGDYIYEYSADTTTYAGGTGVKLQREHQPANEIITEQDYSARYSQYRLDADLQRLHQQYPWIYVYDDHETANDAYTEGAQNHNAGEGLWSARKDAARKVCFNWMPIREQANGAIYRAFAYGDLMQLYMLDTRLDGRDQQLDGVGDNASAELRARWFSPTRTIISHNQYSWLTDNISTIPTRWNVLGNQVMYTQVDVTPVDTAYLFSSIPEALVQFLRPQMPTIISTFELAFLGDVWSNYPAQRKNLSTFFRSNNVDNLVVITGDFHCAFAMDIERTTDSTDSSSVGVEFMTPSVSSPNFNETFATVTIAAPIANQLIETINRTIANNDPHVKYMDVVNHGYLILDVDQQRIQSDYFMVDTLYVRTAAEHHVRSYKVDHGTKRLQQVSQVAPDKVTNDTPAPLYPRIRANNNSTPSIVILGITPAPASSIISISYSVLVPQSLEFRLVDIQGRSVTMIQDGEMKEGLYSTTVDISALASGQYRLVMKSKDTQASYPVVIVR